MWFEKFVRTGLLVLGRADFYAGSWRLEEKNDEYGGEFENAGWRGENVKKLCNKHEGDALEYIKYTLQGNKFPRLRF